MTRAVAAVGVILLPLLVGVDEADLGTEKSALRAETASCVASSGRVAVRVRYYSGQPVQRVWVAVSDSPNDPFGSGSAVTGEDGCAYIKPERVQTGQQTYYITIWKTRKKPRADDKWSWREVARLNIEDPQVMEAVEVKVPLDHYPRAYGPACGLSHS